jgi:uncharacterized protein (TIGR03083 family)
MSAAAIPALESEVRRARELFVTLTPDEWQAPSGCDGWRVQDVVQHMASVFQQIAEPASIDMGDSGRAEVAAEVPVQARREWSTDEVIHAYDEWSAKGVAALTALQDPPMADAVVPLADLGAHPLHLLGNAIVFDHYCHLRHDIGAAVPRAAEFVQDDACLSATLEWMLAGLPQMCADGLEAAPAQSVNLVFAGAGAGAFNIAPGPDGWSVTNGVVEGVPTVRTTAHDFVSWGTKRADWRDLCTGDVDDPAVAAVLDAFNVI